MADDASHSNDYELLQRRRQLLRKAGMLSIAGLAGCSGSDDSTPAGDGTSQDGDGDGDSQGGGTTSQDGGGATPDPTPETFAIMMGGSRPSTANWNPYGKNYIGGRIGALVFEGLTKRYPDPNSDRAEEVTGDDKWAPQILTDFSFPDKVAKGNKITLNLSENYTWSDGTDYTAKDLVGQFKLERFDKLSYWNYVSDVSMVDDYTADLTISKPVDPKILKNSLLSLKGYRQCTFKYDVFGKHVEAIEEASTKEAKQKARQKLTDRQITGPKANELGLGQGPFSVYEDATTSQLLLSKYEDYQNPIGTTAEDIPYEKAAGLPVDAPQKKIRAMKNKRIDAVGNAAMTEPQLESLPDRYKYNPLPGKVGGVFCFNCRRAPFDNQKVRWALSTVFRSNYDLLFENLPYGSSMKAKIPVSAGIGGPDFLEEWLGDIKDQLMRFDGGESEAARLLEDEGFSKQKGSWVKPNGESWTIDFKAATFHKTRTQTATSILSEFGIQANPIVEENGVWFSKTIANNNYDITNWWGGAGVPIAFEHLNFLRGQAGKTAYLNGVPSPNQWEDNIANEKLVVEIPPLGEPEGELSEFNIDETLSDLAVAQSRSEKKELVHELAWAWNWMDVQWGPWLNYRPNMFYDSGSPWDWPAQDSQTMNVPNVHYWPTRLGQPEVKGE